MKGILLLLAVLLLTGFSLPRMDVAAIANDELALLEKQGFALPRHALVTLNWYDYNAFAIITAEPVRYVVVLKSWYFRESQARFTAAHEYGHILLDHHGAPNTEENADNVAACFGSPQAKGWAKVLGITPTPDECDELGKWLGVTK